MFHVQARSLWDGATGMCTRRWSWARFQFCFLSFLLSSFTSWLHWKHLRWCELLEPQGKYLFPKYKHIPSKQKTLRLYHFSLLWRIESWMTQDKLGTLFAWVTYKGLPCDLDLNMEHWVWKYSFIIFKNVSGGKTYLENLYTHFIHIFLLRVRQQNNVSLNSISVIANCAILES